MKLDATTAMIDLHSHILPGIDDGAPDMSTAFDMARMAVDDGIAVMACTPHMLPGVYDADAVEVRRRVAHLNERLIENDKITTEVYQERLDAILQAGHEADTEATGLSPASSELLRVWNDMDAGLIKDSTAAFDEAERRVRERSKASDG